LRELLTHSLRSLSGALVFICLVLLLVSYTGKSLPLPIGALNDYGNVLDRHGRERVNNLIDAAKLRYGIEVSILASWENPYDNVDRYTYEILDSWGLAVGNTILAVFAKKGRDWEVRIVSGQQATKSYPNLAYVLQSGIEDLVAHRRVSEAMVALFSELDKEIGTDKQDVDTKGEGSDRGLWIVLLVVGMGGAIFFVSQRVCPRCGRILRRRTRPSIGSYNEENVVYYCRHCSYTRTVNRKRGPRGRGG
jgi:uncharacterized membrane protein YgcG